MVRVLLMIATSSGAWAAELCGVPLGGLMCEATTVEAAAVDRATAASCQQNTDAEKGSKMIGSGLGQVHPQIVLPSLTDGRPLNLGRFRGKKVLLIQFASW
jgi:hypothetical protein